MVRSALYLICFLAALFFSPLAHSFYADPVPTGHVTVHSITDGVATVDVEFSSRDPASVSTKYREIRGVATPARTGSLLKRVAGGPVGLAITAGLVAYEIFYDPDTGEFVRSAQPINSQTSYSSQHCYYPYLDGASLAQCQAAGVMPGYATESWTVSAAESCYFGVVQGHHVYYRHVYNPEISSDPLCVSNGNYYWQWRVLTTELTDTQQYVSAPTVLTDDELGAYADPAMMRDTLRELATTGELADAWPELFSDAKAWQDNLNEYHYGDPTQVPAEDMQASKDDPAAPEPPAFCEWAPSLCDWLNWTQQDHTPPTDPSDTVQWVDVPDDTWSSGLSGGACPAPVTISLGALGGSTEFSYDHVCGYAANIKPFVLAAAALMAGFIIIGVGRKS